MSASNPYVKARREWNYRYLALERERRLSIHAEREGSSRRTLRLGARGLPGRSARSSGSEEARRPTSEGV